MDDDVVELSADGSFDVSSSAATPATKAATAPEPISEKQTSKDANDEGDEKEEEEDKTPPRKPLVQCHDLLLSQHLEMAEARSTTHGPKRSPTSILSSSCLRIPKPACWTLFIQTRHFALASRANPQ